MNAAERACLAIADISGYTGYLTGVELDHAQDVIADLLSAVVTPLRPTFRLAKLEGDAAFLYAPVESIDGSIMLDLVEASYFGFRSRLLTIQQASACKCDACLLIPQLDLKLVVHHGTVVRQDMLGLEELMGTDVILVHRLLKNRVADEVGADAYAFLTDACVAATALDAEALGMARHRETYDDVGAVDGWVYDLARAWDLQRERTRVYVHPTDAAWTSEGLLPDVELSQAWEWLTSPARKIRWEAGFDDIFEVLPDGGRRGPGAETHCVHGEDVIVNEIVDWRPPSYVTSTGSFPGGAPYVVTDEVVPADGGVLVRKSMKAPSEEARPALNEVLAGFAPILDTWIPTLIELVTEERSAAEPAVEVPLPEPDERRRLETAVEPS